MAAFGSGIMGADPLAEARAAEMKAKRAQTLANIKAAGEGEGKLQGGLNAVGSVAGEHLGAAAARMFGMAPAESPEIAAAKQQAALLEQLNGIEGDTSSAEWARQAGAKALEMGDQRTAYSFAQEAGNRAKAEAAAEQKALATEQDNFNKQWRGAPTVVQLQSLESKDPRVYASLGMTDPDQIEEMSQSAAAEIESNRIKQKHAADKIRNGLDTSLTGTDLKATEAGLTGLGYQYGDVGSEKDEDIAIRSGITALVAGEAANLMAKARQTGGTLSQNDANRMAVESLVQSGQLKQEVTGPKSAWNFFGPDEGTKVLSIGVQAAPTQPQAAATQASPAATRRIVLK